MCRERNAGRFRAVDKEDRARSDAGCCATRQRQMAISPSLSLSGAPSLYSAYIAGAT